MASNISNKTLAYFIRECQRVCPDHGLATDDDGLATADDDGLATANDHGPARSQRHK